MPISDKIEQAIARVHCEIPIGHGAKVETCILCCQLRTEIRNALEEAERSGAYKLFLAARERSQSICRRCEPKLSTYEIAEEFDKLFHPKDDAEMEKDGHAL